MSDGMTDGARALERSNNFLRYLNVLGRTLEDSSPENSGNLQRLADRVYGGRRYPHNQISVADELDELLENLRNGCTEVWARVLIQAMTCISGIFEREEQLFRTDVFDRLKRLSPFADKQLVIAERYGRHSAVSLTGEDGMLVSFLPEGGEERTLETYLLALPTIDPAEVTVEQTHPRR